MSAHAWAWLLLAGSFEIAFSQSIRPTANFSRPLPTLVCLLLGAASIYCLTHAMNELPVGTAYVLFTGIGSFGAVTLGIVLSGDPLTWTRLVGLGLIVSGIALSHATSSTA